MDEDEGERRLSQLLGTGHLHTETVIYKRVALSRGPLAGQIVTVTDRQTSIVIKSPALDETERDIEYLYALGTSGSWTYRGVVIDE